MKFLKPFSSCRIKIESLWWLVLFAILLLFHLNHPIDSDEGVILEGAWKLWNKKRLYTDFFEFVPPGGFYFVYWIWKIFGVGYFAPKIASIIIIFLSGAGIFKISGLLKKTAFNYLPPLIFVFLSMYWPLINHNTYNIFFIIWSVYFFIRALISGSKNHYALAGLAAGISVLFLQQKGAILIISSFALLVLFSLLYRKLDYLKMSLYYGLSFLPPLLILLKWPLDLIYKNLAIFPLANGAEINKLPLNFFFLALFMIAAIFTAYISLEKFSLPIKYLAGIQAALFATTLVRPDLNHINLVIFPALCLIPSVFSNPILFNSTKSIIGAASLSAASILLCVSVFPLANFLIFTPSFLFSNESAVINYIRKNCQDPGNYLYAGPFLPGLYFETGMMNPTPYSFLITNHQTESQFAEARNILAKVRPRCAILNYSMVEGFRYNQNNPVDSFIRNNYHQVFRERNALVYKINE
ncbi:MAG: glycosyltransferase family 39 protein [Patescibacteria group bacterium]|jgi:hypothetical protein